MFDSDWVHKLNIPGNIAVDKSAICAFSGHLGGIPCI